MNQKIKALWIEALRSGKYKQGQRFLKAENKFCCLGVLCDLHRKTLKKNHWGTSPLDPRGGQSYMTCKGVLPNAVSQWAGLLSRNPEVNGETLSELNDHLGATFDQIADLIENNL